MTALAGHTGSYYSYSFDEAPAVSPVHGALTAICAVKAPRAAADRVRGRHADPPARG